MIGYGIDFGTTNSIVAGYTPGERDPFTRLAGLDGRPHPSVVWYRLGLPPTVGRDAKLSITARSESPGNAFVSSIKPKLGQNVRLDILGAEREAWEIASDIFTHLLKHAAERGKEIQDAVVTVPIRFDGRARRDLRKAADRAGLHITTFVHEPFAAVVGYLYGGPGRRDLRDWAGRTVLVFDWGGGTLDVTIAKVTAAGLVELATDGLPNRSGDYFDELILREVSGRTLRDAGLTSEDTRVDPSKRDRLLFECEGAKIALSEHLISSVQLVEAFRSSGGSITLDTTVSRHEFEELIGSTVDSAAQLVDRLLISAHLSPRQVDDVLLIGGTSLIPLVRQRLHDLFGSRLIRVPNADTVIAEGAAVVAALGMQPFFARTIAVGLSDGSYFPIIPENRPAVPAACDQTLNFFCTDHRDGLARLVLAESTAYAENRLYHTKRVLPIPVSSTLRKEYIPERVTVHFAMDSDLVLHVNGRAATQGASRSMEIEDLCFGLTYGKVG